MREFIEQHGIVALILAVSLSLNAVLSGVAFALEKLDELIPGDTDKKVAAFLRKVVKFLRGLVDFLGSNKEHKKKA